LPECFDAVRKIAAERPAQLGLNVYLVTGALEAMQRKPSHFGSYCHASPSGITSTDFASIGFSVSLTGSMTPLVHVGVTDKFPE
jgi:hypothetical protein